MRYKCNRLFETNNSRIKTRIRMTTGYSFGGGRVCFLGGVMISGRLASGDQKLTLEVVPLPPSSGGDLPCISHVYTHPRPQGWHLRRFGLKRCIDFTHERIYRFNSKWIRKKTGEMLEFEWILRNLFSWRSNLSNDDIISQGPGLKTGEKNDTFSRSGIGSGFGEPGGPPPPRIPRTTPWALLTLHWLIPIALKFHPLIPFQLLFI